MSNTSTNDSDGNTAKVASTGGNSGLDVYTPTDVLIEKGARGFIIDLMVKASMLTSDGAFAGYWLVPRSSISKTPIRMSNSVGIIDSGYRGNLKVAVDNVGEVDWVCKGGERMFQICKGDLGTFEWEIVEEIQGGDTDRGEGGFGSTGK
ncbi:hypothetical protein TrCOL_g3918 [Triparma columacea]|uniref:Deoxyuridine 5'-triphosphate nucleotidohydrolase n=1 Tax=Triparma columacea TaxID=722753 RepID=A0A9W7GBA4_9STRA|nr:hypothetical protein TrCOL_g3918 [Triparma columacea]